MRFLLLPLLALIISNVLPPEVSFNSNFIDNHVNSDQNSEHRVYVPLISRQEFFSSGDARGYLITPQELSLIKQKADQGMEPYRSSVEIILEWAAKDWNFPLNAIESCDSSDDPLWLDNTGGTPILYAKALAYHLTRETHYGQEVKLILQRIMSEVKAVSTAEDKCQLTFAWGTPELIASADLIEGFLKGQPCKGPLSTHHGNSELGWGDCKVNFQNWLVKNSYYVVSEAAVRLSNNWGAAATTATAYIADYLWDRPEVKLVHRNPWQVNDGKDVVFSPAEAYAFANQLALDRMNGYKIAYAENSCDHLTGAQQSGQWPAVKTQITETGIVPEDATREEYCNIPKYNGEHQMYPQLHLALNIQQCELMLRRGDSSCYDNVDNTDIVNYSYVGPSKEIKHTHLKPGRGSIERAIKAIIVDSGTEWKRDAALAVAYRYYYNHHTLAGFDQWLEQLNEEPHCDHDICFGILTHGFALNENPGLPQTTPPPGSP